MQVVVTCQRMVAERMARDGRTLDAPSLVAFLGELFDTHDVNSTGLLEVEEFKLLITEIAGPEHTLTNVDQRNIFATLNFSSSGGSIDRDEFIKFLTPHADQRVLGRLPHPGRMSLGKAGKRAEKRAVLQTLSGGGGGGESKPRRSSFSLAPGDMTVLQALTGGGEYKKAPTPRRSSFSLQPGQHFSEGFTSSSSSYTNEAPGLAPTAESVAVGSWDDVL